MITQADIDSLNQAIRDGVRQVTVGGITTTYNTTESLIKARDDLINQMSIEQNAATGRAYPRVTRLVHGGRGYQGCNE